MSGLRNHVVSPNSWVLSPNHVKFGRKHYVKRNKGNIRRLGVCADVQQMILRILERRVVQ